MTKPPEAFDDLEHERRLRALTDRIADVSTPRTDNAAHGFCQANPQKTDVDMWSIPCVDADFARQLERENISLREHVSVLRAGMSEILQIDRPNFGLAFGRAVDIAAETLAAMEPQP